MRPVRGLYELGKQPFTNIETPVVLKAIQPVLKMLTDRLWVKCGTAACRR